MILCWIPWMARTFFFYNTLLQFFRDNSKNSIGNFSKNFIWIFPTLGKFSIEFVELSKRFLKVFRKEFLQGSFDKFPNFLFLFLGLFQSFWRIMPWIFVRNFYVGSLQNFSKDLLQNFFKKSQRLYPRIPSRIPPGISLHCTREHYLLKSDHKISDRLVEYS